MSYIAGFLTFMSIGGFPSFVEDMKVRLCLSTCNQPRSCSGSASIFAQLFPSRV
jgi:hypothetical protein